MFQSVYTKHMASMVKWCNGAIGEMDAGLMDPISIAALVHYFIVGLFLGKFQNNSHSLPGLHSNHSGSFASLPWRERPDIETCRQLHNDVWRLVNYSIWILRDVSWSTDNRISNKKWIWDYDFSINFIFSINKDSKLSSILYFHYSAGLIYSLFFSLGFPPVTVPLERKIEYYESLTESNRGDLRIFVRFFADCALKTIDVIFYWFIS